MSKNISLIIFVLFILTIILCDSSSQIIFFIFNAIMEKCNTALYLRGALGRLGSLGPGGHVS